MDETISAADANRKFSLLLRGVREGRSYVVTSHGKPVARLVPADENREIREQALTVLLARLRE
jgi:prevent-host-death family protein